MTSATALKKKSTAKAGYYIADGSRVPSVTTILNVINKPALVTWANKLGLQGIDSTKYVDALANVGTLTHEMVLAELRGEDPAAVAASESKATIDLVENCFISYLAWRKGKTIEPILMEVPLVSEAHRFGGRFDFYGRIDGTLTLADFKTGKGIWPEHFYQLAAYGILLEENGYEAPAISMILNIPRADTESFDTKGRAVLERERDLFLHARWIYELKASIEGR